MKKTNTHLFVLFIFCSIFMSKQLIAQSDPNARDLVKLTEWFEGEFDNDSQVWYENRYSWKGNPEERHNRMHSIHTKIDAPALGKNVFYVEEFLDGDPTKISRQRIVSFTSNAPETSMTMTIYFLKEAKKYVGAHKQSEILKGIGETDLFGVDGCDVIFQREGEQYHGSMLPKACVFGESKLRRYSVHDIIISENQYWRIDRTFLLENDQFHKGHPTPEPHKMRKAKFYNCDIAYYEKAYYMPSDKDQKFKSIKIHNQGGMEWFENKIDGKKYGFQIRDKQYPFYEDGSDFTMLRFIQEGEKASKLIIIADPEAKTLSFQMGWASASCKLED